MIQEHQTIQAVFDTPLPALCEPMFALFREGQDVANRAVDERNHVVYRSNLGWRLRFANADLADETVSATDLGCLTLSDGSLVATSQFHDVATQETLTLLGVSSISHGQGTMQRRTVPSGDSWNLGLTGDSFASAPVETTAVPSIRVAKSRDSFDGSRPITFSYQLPLGVSGSVPSRWFTFYFTGAAGSNSDAVGTGQYALDVLWSHACLYEKTADGWCFRRNFKNGLGSYSGKALSNGTYVLRIEQVTGRSSGAIHFKVGNDADGEDEKSIGRYLIPSPTPAGAGPIRVEIPQDHRPSFRIQVATFSPSGTLKGYPFALDHPVTAANPLVLRWFGDVPTGTSISVQLLKPGGSPLTLVDTHADAHSGTSTFNLSVEPGAISAEQSYQPFFTLTSSDGSLSPCLTSYMVTRAPVLQEVTGEEFVVPNFGVNAATSDLEGLTILQPSLDPTREKAELHLVDFNNDLLPLRTNGDVQAQIRLTDTASGVYSILAHGHILGSPNVQIGGGPATRIDSTIEGEWVRLAGAKLPGRLRFDPDNFVVDCLYSLIQAAGYDDSMIDVPTSSAVPVRLFNERSEDFLLEPYVPILDQILGLLHDYLGAALVFDPNAGTKGKWRIILRPRLAESSPKCIFWRRVPPGDFAAVHSQAAYGSTCGLVDGFDQTIPRTFVVQGSLSEWTEAPEATSVFVTGGVYSPSAQSASGQATPTLFSRWAVNVRAYNTFSLSPGDSGYPNVNRAQNSDFVGYHKSLFVKDFSLQSQAAVDWVCRRYFESACKSRVHRRFRAPLVLISDSSDSHQTRPRPLRIFDEVFMEEADGVWQRYSVASCDIVIEKACAAMADYHLVSAPTLTGVLAGPRSTTQREVLARAVFQADGRALRTRSTYSINRETDALGGDLFSIPTVLNQPIQDLDPGSASFGEFIGPEGYV